MAGRTPNLRDVDGTLVDRVTGAEYGGGDGAAKARAFISWDGAGAPSIDASFGVASIADTGVGSVTITWETPFTTATYAVLATVADAGSSFARVDAITTTTARVLIRDTATGASVDPTIGLMVAAFGAQ